MDTSVGGQTVMSPELSLVFKLLCLILYTVEVWSSGLGTVGRDPGNKPVLVYLTGSLFTTDNQLIAPQVGKGFRFQCMYCIWSEKYYSLSAVKSEIKLDAAKESRKAFGGRRKPHIMRNYYFGIWLEDKEHFQ
jgi:hypothetical protein